MRTLRHGLMLLALGLASLTASSQYVLPTSVPFVYVPPSAAPAPAQAVGYTNNSFNSTTLGTTAGYVFQNLNFFGSNTAATQNANGSITVAGVTIDPQIATARKDSTKSVPYQFDGIAFGCGAYVQATLAWPVGTGYIYGNIASLNNLVGGSGYVNGTYSAVPLTGGSGTLAAANIVVSGGAVSSVTLTATGYGTNYVTGDTLSASNSNLGGSGSGFSINVAQAFSAWPALWAYVAESMSVANTVNAVNSTTIWPGLTTTETSGNANIAVNFNPTNIYLTQTSATTWAHPYVVFCTPTSNSNCQSGTSAGTITNITPGTVYYVVGGDTSHIQVSTTYGLIATTGNLAGGSGYVNGTYTAVPLTGGSGSGAQATIVVSGGAVTSVTVTAQGVNYVANNVLSASNSNLGGSGSGFTIQVLTISGGAAITPNGTGNFGILFDDEIEWDLEESDRNTSASISFPSALHNWFSYPGSATRTDATSFPIATTTGGTYYSQPHTYAGLWVPATSTTSGYLTQYLDGTAINTVTWAKYSASNPPPPTGTAVGSVLDQRHLFFIINGTVTMPVTVTDFEVWQGPGACNVVQ